MIKESSLKIADIAVGVIDTNPNNPNEMNDESFGRLVDEIKEIGFIDPITVIPSGDRYKILNGEHRLKAAVSAGYEFIPSIIIYDEKFNDPDVFELVNIRLNEIRGKLSPVKMQPIYDRVVQKFGEENVQRILGITSDDIYKKLIKKMATNFKKSTSAEVAEKIDAQAEKQKDPASFSRAVSKIIRDEAEKSMQSKCIIFQSVGKEHVIIRANDTTFSAASELVRKCQNEHKDINELLFPALADLIKVAQKETKDDLFAI
jgi:ParB/RepB/Spo0J family partition protein